ncbi:MAG: glycosyltransferase involved in cell wall biosynthesis [Arenicella sp.]|jgi:glycosyltransferase involved in cell wall biosynthesis
MVDRMNDKISFIIASYNDETIDQTIASITKQIHALDEIIVMDGKSTDNTVQRAKGALKDVSNSMVFSEHDTGIYNAWNKAIAQASGSWLVFLGCGDLLTDQYRKEVSDVINKQENINFIHHKTQFYTRKKTTILKGRVFGRRLDKVEFARRMRVCHVGALHHKSLFYDFKFSTLYQCVSDYHFLLRHLVTLRPHYIDKILVDMESGGISSHTIFPYAEERRMKRQLGGYNNITLSLGFFSSVVKAILFRLYDSIR